MTQHIDPEDLGRKAGRELAQAPLTLRQQTRLAAGREKALAATAAQKAPVRLLAGLQGWSVRHPSGSRRLGQAAWVAIMLMAGLVWWHNQPDSFIDDDVDTQLLADEVPMEAWLLDQADMTGQGQS